MNYKHELPVLSMNAIKVTTPSLDGLMILPTNLINLTVH
jgi:hypothetical protein